MIFNSEGICIWLHNCVVKLLHNTVVYYTVLLKKIRQDIVSESHSILIDNYHMNQESGTNDSIEIVHKVDKKAYLDTHRYINLYTDGGTRKIRKLAKLYIATVLAILILVAVFLHVAVSIFVLICWLVFEFDENRFNITRCLAESRAANIAKMFGETTHKWIVGADGVEIESDDYPALGFKWEDIIKIEKFEEHTFVIIKTDEGQDVLHCPSELVTVLVRDEADKK